MDQQNTLDYSFRVLTKEDLPQIRALFIDTFLEHNELMIAMNYTKEELKDLDSVLSLDYPAILEQNLSFGAFFKDKLVSYTLASDYKTQYPPSPILVKDSAKKFLNFVGNLNRDFKIQEQNTEQGIILHLYLIATDSNHFQKKLAYKNLQLSKDEAQKRGFQRFMAEAAHIGTIKAIQKVFGEEKVRIEKEAEFNGAKQKIVTAQF